MGRVFVTGIGIISAIGIDASSNRQALVNGKNGITKLELFSSRYADLPVFGEVKIGNVDLKDKLNISDAGVSRTTLLAAHAIHEAIKDSGLSTKDIRSDKTALICGTTVAGMCLTDELYKDANSVSDGSEYLNSYDCGSVGLYLQKYFGVSGVVDTINSACSSSSNSIMYGARLIKSGFAQRAIVGGTDSLAKFTINGFNALHILSDERCKPFDRNRNGLNLGEAGAFLILEDESCLGDKNVYAEVTGYCNTNDAFHASSLSDNGEGPYLAMQGALKMAGLQSRSINLINVHGTGTENNDLVESRAMMRLFETQPDFSCSKSNIGHTLGASGAVSALYGLLSIKYEEVYPSLHFSDPIPETGLIPVLKHEHKKIQHVMSNSFGFGGNCTSLIFSRS